MCVGEEADDAYGTIGLDDGDDEGEDDDDYYYDEDDEQQLGESTKDGGSPRRVTHSVEAFPFIRGYGHNRQTRIKTKIKSGSEQRASGSNKNQKGAADLLPADPRSGKRWGPSNDGNERRRRRWSRARQQDGEEETDLTCWTY